MNAKTKLVKQWHRELKKLWKDKPMMCEFGYPNCTRTFGLTPAHSKKRRFIQTKEDYFEIAIACLNCHRILDERMSHEAMHLAVTTVIKLRAEQCPSTEY